MSKSKKQVLVLSAFTVNERADGPKIAIYPDAVELLSKVKKLKEVAEQHGLKEVHVDCPSSWCPLGSEVELGSGTLAVNKAFFYLYVVPVAADHVFQTELLTEAELEALVDSGKEVIFSDSDLEDCYLEHKSEQMV
ncbi:hypothetical protein ACK249_003744 [Pseudomonas aeruginosa]|uniref:hypothetical protein n=1 Tax=Pseudomonas aeruginosa TaxID=287 RepID=UPI002554D83F|nr:hypothetical protein [Pseudomonas aeruginosa]EKF7416709.1 hypothetical protein [Pseudomonas aeruginosa]HBO1617630.1 hypothetical protein [Pseudomonas aeruginosa]HBO9385133.1 hypothetical protein [Pseudomonas aeruginosa]HCA5867078.1 hypothetical protein [Pseudomonas aeruginosa]HCA7377491.1 hypothetical protein [Pseudomonas aeruginosa]